MMQQATYLQASLLAANLNFLQREIAAGTGYILPPNFIEIPRPPFPGEQMTLNNINVSGSTIGAINTGTVKNLDAAITLFAGRGQAELASAIKEFTEGVIASDELKDEVKREVAEQLQFLVGQVSAKKEQRSPAIIKSVIGGIRSAIANAANVIVIWDKLERILNQTLV